MFWSVTRFRITTAGRKLSIPISSPASVPEKPAFTSFHNVEDPHDVFLLLDWESVEEARKFMNSGELRDRMQKAGVAGRARDSVSGRCACGASLVSRLKQRDRAEKFSQVLLTAARVLRFNSISKLSICVYRSTVDSESQS